MKKEEEQQDSIYGKLDSFLTKISKVTFSAISSLITVIAALIGTLFDASQNLEVVQANKNKIFVSLGAVAVTLFASLFIFQLIIIKKKKNEKIEKLKSNLVDKYISAIEQSFINPKNI